MTLPSGSRLGPCEILAPIGAGGMGEVYRAKDPRLSPEQIKAKPYVYGYSRAVASDLYIVEGLK